MGLLKKDGAIKFEHQEMRNVIISELKYYLYFLISRLVLKEFHAASQKWESR